ncbi:carbohydrate kinase family protein [Thermofilum pendens]|uniref:6-phosphofructokinase / cytidine kinase / inosine-guanosine kinase n=1 Tax=Thermofilum pendens (strain DSM 2475 / Hrk 5) TaxID=368408 RepID=A1S0R4_THEPD|nr:carbohydrate kinase family protein [Thermofilum pendens]ABL79044.1 6-phosphofructokinase / cytidine kinase / inosine-guanosine kinase [Thermofilum pendens Hrk 5]
MAFYDVVTLGHILLDLRFCVDAFATPDREGVIKSQSHGVGGSAANVAIGVRRLGGRSAVIGKVGFDDFGKNALEDLVREGVDISNVRIDALNGKTGFTIVIIDSQGQIVMYGDKGVAESLQPEEVNLKILKETGHLHIASLRVDTSAFVAKAAKELGVRVSWDPGRRQARMGIEALKPIVRLADIVLPNEIEVKAIAGVEDVKEAANVLLGEGAGLVIVKRGSRGVYVVSKDEEFEVPAYRPETVVDTTGAGDAFAAGLLMGLKRFDLRDAVRFATVVAGLKVTRLGSHEIPTWSEAMEVFEKVKQKQ